LYRKRNYESKLRGLFAIAFLFLTLAAIYFWYNAVLDVVNKDMGVMTLIRACFSVYFLRHGIHSAFGIFKRQLILLPTNNERELFYKIEDAENN